MPQRFILPFQTVFDLNGKPLDGAKLIFTESGGSTPKDTFSDEALTIPNTNPVVANNQGEFDDIFLESGDYRVELTDKDDVTQPNYPADPVRDSALNLDTVLRSDLASTTNGANKGHKLVFIERIAAEIAGGVTPTNYYEQEGYVERYGAVGDDDGTGSGTDDAAAFDAAISAMQGGWITIKKNKKYRIATQLATTEIIRIKSDAPPIFEDSGDVTNNDDDWFPTIILDAISLVGVADPSSIATGFSKLLRGLQNIKFKGVNNAPYLAHFRPTQGFYENLLIEDFDYHGWWTRGGSLPIFNNIRFIRCGRTDPVVNSWCHLAANTTLASRNYRRGCSWLAECRNTDDQSASYDAGREASGIYRPTTFSIENVWSDTNSGTTQLNTSPRDFIFFGHLDISQNGLFGGYNGSWFGLSNGSFDLLYQETNATGGVVSGDGTAFSLVMYNTAISFAQIFQTEDIRNLQDLGFSSAQDFYGYDLRQNANHYKSRMNIFELILGGWKPDASSTDWGTYASKGTTDNPSLIFNSVTRSLDISIGNNHLPTIGFSLEQKGTVVDSGGTATIDRNTVTELTGADAQGRWFEVEVFVGRINASYDYYYSVWRCVRTSSQTRWVKVVELDLLGGVITVAETGGGAKDLLITNNHGSETFNWKAFGKILGDRQLDIDN
jgi:hypothetical protein